MPSSLHIILTELPRLRPSEIFYVSKAVEDQAMSIATVTTASDEIKEKRHFEEIVENKFVLHVLLTDKAILQVYQHVKGELMLRL